MANHIQIILKRDVGKLGRAGDVVRVRPGYARNYLFPNLYALPASLSRLVQLESQKIQAEQQRNKLQLDAEIIKNNLSRIQIIIKSKSGESGKLFGSISVRDISFMLAKHGFSISHKDIKVNTPIKTVGIHDVEINLTADLKTIIAISVVGG